MAPSATSGATISLRIAGIGRHVVGVGGDVGDEHDLPGAKGAAHDAGAPVVGVERGLVAALRAKLQPAVDREVDGDERVSEALVDDVDDPLAAAAGVGATGRQRAADRLEARDLARPAPLGEDRDSLQLGGAAQRRHDAMGAEGEDERDAGEGDPPLTDGRAPRRGCSSPARGRSRP